MSTHISIKQAAKILNLSEQQTRSLCRSGGLQASKIGRSWIVEKDKIMEYGLKSSHVVAENHPASISKKNKSKKPIALSFFSGAMGLDLGLEKAGFDIRSACENDKYCRQTIELNRPDLALLGDINDYSADDVLENAGVKKNDVDLIVGGPPCQAFSTAGKRNGLNDDRGNVFLKYLDLALEINPKYIVIENVRGLLSCPMQHRPHDQRGEDFPDLSFDELRGGALNYILNRLRSSNYSYSFNLYNAANFGTPQVRERVIIVCSRDGEEPPFLVPTHSDDAEVGLPKWRTFRQAVQGIDTCHHINFPEKRLKFYRLLKSGQNWRNLPVDLQKEALGKSFYSGGGKTGFLRRLAWDKPSPTLVTHPAMPATDLAHPEEERPVSVEEYKRVQQFPDSWKLAGPLIQQYKQIGNAVPIGLGHALGKLVMSLLKHDDIEIYEGFRYSRYKNTSCNEWESEFMKQIDNAGVAFQQGKLNFT
ncbi:MAG: Modification methylase SinI [uncultured Thiotrichaceae bacterium]|uniref:Cytosine-specific methyltransferase n=1 Tax=uncultured Thiotrichaceae bacterium TaxID=298394 RepID=A0A6S6SRK7_9GAMM|nr:MAG: Modification methylase SinI [uncultured Thiotrichaceae bacterium]